MPKLDFSSLVSPYSAGDFLAEYWQKYALLIRGNEKARFQTLLPATDIESVLLMADKLPSEAVELVGRTSEIEHEKSKSHGVLKDLFIQGSTIRVRGIEKHSGPLTELCRNIEEELGFPTRANLYCTPAGARGFDLHFDTHEVLVLQLLGKKKWQVYESTFRLPLEYVPPLIFEDDRAALKRARGGRQAGQDGISEAELGPLYLPRGFVHQAESLDEASGSVIAVASIWCIRPGMWYLVPLIRVITIFLLILRQVREKRLLVVNLCCVLLALATFALVPKALPPTRSRLTLETVREPMLWQRIASNRRRSVKASSIHPGSYIDTDVRFDGVLDIIRYSPRAIIIGLFAPFPNMWFTAGQQAGWLGKLLAGFETLLTYIIELLCVAGIWQRRKEFVSWLLISTAVLGAGSIALVLVSVGSVYRMRYVFWMLLVVLSSGGLVRLFSKVSREKKE